MMSWYLCDNYIDAEDTFLIAIVSLLAFSNLHLEAMLKHQSSALLHLKRFVHRCTYLNLLHAGKLYDIIPSCKLTNFLLHIPQRLII
jgi:hypothetical protein